MALVSILAFWCGNVEEQIDRIFRTSGLMRDKWDRQTGDATYGQITIRNAVATNDTIYAPIRDMESAEAEFSDLDEAETLPSFEPDLSKVSMTLEEMQPHTNPRYQREEIGIGYAFADYFKPIARFDRERGIWYVFDGKVWQPDENALAVAELAKRLADRLYTFALQIKDEDTRNRYIKRVQKLQMRKNRRTMIEDAKSVYPVPHSIFDRNTDLFNCQNGTLNLTTGEFKLHDPADFLTLMSGITYNPDAACDRWTSFISEVMMNDADLALYLQKALGYALTGDTSLECLFILYGATSRNGKGTTMETFLKIMGDYGKTSNPEMLSTKFGNTNASGPSEEIARLAGVRFVNISEPEKKITFNAALVKRMTGNDTLNARFLHENSFDFKPNFKIFINTNYKPSVSDMTLFYSNRLKLIPFKRHFGIEYLDGLDDSIGGSYETEELVRQTIQGHLLHYLMKEEDQISLARYDGKVYAFDFATSLYLQAGRKNLPTQFTSIKQMDGLTVSEEFVLRTESNIRKDIARYINSLEKRGVTDKVAISVYEDFKARFVDCFNKTGFGVT